MCGRYIYFDGKNPTLRNILKRTKQEYPELFRQLALFDVRPADTSLALVHDPKFNKDRLIPMVWGFKSNRSLSINARIETLLHTSIYQDARPCVLLCSAFYEFDSKHQPYTLQNGNVLYMAGLYRPYADGSHFVILTEPAGQPICSIHDRQPVLLTRAQAFHYCRCTSFSEDLGSVNSHVVEVTMKPAVQKKRAVQLPLF